MIFVRGRWGWSGSGDRADPARFRKGGVGSRSAWLWSGQFTSVFLIGRSGCDRSDQGQLGSVFPRLKVSTICPSTSSYDWGFHFSSWAFVFSLCKAFNTMSAWKKRFPDSDGCARSGNVLQQQKLESGVTMCSGGVKAWQAHLGKIPYLGMQMLGVDISECLCPAQLWARENQQPRK